MQRLQALIKPLNKKSIFSSKVIRNLSEERSGVDGGNVSNEVTTNQEKIDDSSKLGGFAKAFDKFSKPKTEIVKTEEPQTFRSLLRNSQLIDLGDPQGKIVTGKIFHVVNDDLYIDFGWKFYCVCPRPFKNGSDYVRGASVKLRVKDLELSTKFLGAKKDLTILEADCTLMGLINTPMRNVKSL